MVISMVMTLAAEYFKKAIKVDQNQFKEFRKLQWSAWQLCRYTELIRRTSILRIARRPAMHNPTEAFLRIARRASAHLAQPISRPSRDVLIWSNCAARTIKKRKTTLISWGAETNLFYKMNNKNMLALNLLAKDYLWPTSLFHFNYQHIHFWFKNQAYSKTNDFCTKLVGKRLLTTNPFLDLCFFSIHLFVMFHYQDSF